jgi:hypothetical protein
MTTHSTGVSFGIMTAPMHVDYRDLLRVWSEADAIRQIEHAWLFDHLMPIGGDPNGPTYEGWTLLAACRSTTPPTPWAASPKPARSSDDCGPSPTRLISTGNTTSWSGRSATPNRSSVPTRPS